MISYLKNIEINREKWDDCINNAVNSLPYAYSWWLDVVSPGWEALVMDDYDAVMPLTRNVKAGIEYIYQPYFTQQLGVFFKHETDCNNFLIQIPPKFRYITIQLNTHNHPVCDEFIIKKRSDYLLDLSPGYSALLTSYHRNCRRNINKALRAGLEVNIGPGPSAFSHFVHQQIAQKIITGRHKLFHILPNIIMASLEHYNAEILGVYSRSRVLMAAGWFVYSPARCLFMVCASTPAGKDNEAMYLLVDHVIRKKAGSGLIFDFTGSDSRGIAYFNSGFGATDVPYAAVKRNTLPWPLSLIKK